MLACKPVARWYERCAMYAESNLNEQKESSNLYLEGKKIKTPTKKENTTAHIQNDWTQMRILWANVCFDCTTMCACTKNKKAKIFPNKVKPEQIECDANEGDTVQLTQNSHQKKQQLSFFLWFYIHFRHFWIKFAIEMNAYRYGKSWYFFMCFLFQTFRLIFMLFFFSLRSIPVSVSLAPPFRVFSPIFLWHYCAMCSFAMSYKCYELVCMWVLSHAFASPSTSEFIAQTEFI